jgi:protein TonB
MLISVALHSLIIASGITLQSSIADNKKPVVIDFDIANPAPKIEQPVKKTTPEPPKPKQVKIAPQPTPRPEVPRQVNLPPAPVKTATEAAGPVAVSAPPRAAAPPPAETAKGPVGPAGPVHAGSGGSGTSTETLKNRYLREHFEYIKELVQKSIVYPPRAKRMGWMGKVVVSFLITENGRTKNQKIIKSSGYDLLDNNVVETIKSLEPYPKPPASAEIRIPVVFNLE